MIGEPGANCAIDASAAALTSSSVAVSDAFTTTIRCSVCSG